MYGVDFSPNGYHLATGSDDHTCRVWDLRKKQCLYIIPAHNSLISQVKYEPSEGYFLVTASFDNTSRVNPSNGLLVLRLETGHHKAELFWSDYLDIGLYQPILLKIYV